MKNTVEAEDLRNHNYEPFHEPLSGAMELASEPGDIFVLKESSEGKFLDLLLSVIKWVFLFIPGAAVIHFIMLGFALLYFYDDWSFGLVVASAGPLVFSTFMAMLGIGKLRDLRYLRVPASIFAMGGLASILYSILIFSFPEISSAPLPN